MAIATVQFMSKALWRQMTYTVLLPDEMVGPGPYPVLYQLHGGNQDHTAWLHHSKLAHYVRHLPLIVVLPDGAQSRWANGGQPFTHYEDFLMIDLADHVIQTFHATTAGPWAVGGNSMGGFGAIRLGLKYPARFSSVWAHSGVYPTAATLPAHWDWDGKAEDLDCYALAGQCDPLWLPRLSFDCGTDDHLLDSNRRFHAYLEGQGIPHTYQEHLGGHDWNYWDGHLPEALEQHCAALKLPR